MVQVTLNNLQNIKQQKMTMDTVLFDKGKR